MTPSISIGSKFGGSLRAIERIPSAFSFRSNRSMTSRHRNASSRCFGVMRRSGFELPPAARTFLNFFSEWSLHALKSRD